MMTTCCATSALVSLEQLFELQRLRIKCGKSEGMLQFDVAGGTDLQYGCSLYREFQDLLVDRWRQKVRGDLFASMLAQTVDENYKLNLRLRNALLISNVRRPDFQREIEEVEETVATDGQMRIQQSDLKERLIEERLIEERLIEERLIEERLIEERLIEERLIEERLIEERLIEERLIEAEKTVKELVRRLIEEQMQREIDVTKSKMLLEGYGKQKDTQSNGLRSKLEEAEKKLQREAEREKLLEKTINEKDDEKKKLEREVEKLNSNAASIKKTINEKDDEKKKLEREVEKLNSTVASMTVELAAERQKRKQLDEQVKKLTEQVATEKTKLMKALEELRPKERVMRPKWTTEKVQSVYIANSLPSPPRMTPPTRVSKSQPVPKLTRPPPRELVSEAQLKLLQHTEAVASELLEQKPTAEQMASILNTGNIAKHVEIAA